MTPLPLAGAFVLEHAPSADERGYFQRLWSAGELAAVGADATVRQTSVSYNRRRGTLRGMHWQAAPHTEAKTIACLRGAVWDVLVDLRDGSPTRGKWHAVELSADNHLAVHIPAGFAHGFQTLVDDSELLYFISADFVPEAARGFRYDSLPIPWPLPVTVISERDRTLPPFR